MCVVHVGASFTQAKAHASFAASHINVACIWLVEVVGLVRAAYALGKAFLPIAGYVVVIPRPPGTPALP